MSKSKTSFRYFPEERLDPGYPFGIWLAGCIALSKGILWLFLSSFTPPIFLFPFFIAFGFGIWNVRRWAWWGLIGVSLAEIAAILFLPWFSLFSHFQTGEKYGDYTVFFNFVIGPGGALAILIAVIASKHFFFKEE